MEKNIRWGQRLELQRGGTFQETFQKLSTEVQQGNLGWCEQWWRNEQSRGEICFNQWNAAVFLFPAVLSLCKFPVDSCSFLWMSALLFYTAMDWMMRGTKSHQWKIWTLLTTRPRSRAEKTWSQRVRSASSFKIDQKKTEVMMRNKPNPHWCMETE